MVSVKTLDKTRRTPAGRQHTKILSYQDRNVRVDEEIALLISNMWKLGINTLGCCQAHCSFECDHTIKVHPAKKWPHIL